MRVLVGAVVVGAALLFVAGKAVNGFYSATTATVKVGATQAVARGGRGVVIGSCVRAGKPVACAGSEEVVRVPGVVSCREGRGAKEAAVLKALEALVPPSPRVRRAVQAAERRDRAEKC